MRHPDAAARRADVQLALGRVAMLVVDLDRGDPTRPLRGPHEALRAQGVDVHGAVADLLPLLGVRGAVAADALAGRDRAERLVEVDRALRIRAILVVHGGRGCDAALAG